ncbi:hypothetical protein Tco_0390591 [Tanacetum coccineum]
METIQVKFDELTIMDYERNSLEPDSNRINFQDLSAQPSRISTKEDLDNLFGLMYKEYVEKRTLTVSTNFVAPDSIHNDDTPSSTTIIVAEDEAPHIDLSHMHEFYQKHPSTDKWTQARPLEQVIGDPTKPVMT